MKIYRKKCYTCSQKVNLFRINNFRFCSTCIDAGEHLKVPQPEPKFFKCNCGNKVKINQVGGHLCGECYLKSRSLRSRAKKEQFNKRCFR